MAIGYNAKATRDNQIVLGTEDSELTIPGLATDSTLVITSDGTLKVSGSVDESDEEDDLNEDSDGEDTGSDAADGSSQETEIVADNDEPTSESDS